MEISLNRIAVLIVMIAVVGAACGDGSDSDAATATTAAAEVAAPTTLAPTTTEAPAPSTTEAAPTTTTMSESAIVPGDDPDVDAIVLAYETAFDSVSDFETKAPFIDDPTGLEDTVAQYLTTGTTMGGIGVAVTEVVIDGDTATVTYDLLFNDNPTYPDLTGSAVLTDAGWQVPRANFCSLMSSARVGCPDS